MKTALVAKSPQPQPDLNAQNKLSLKWETFQSFLLLQCQGAKVMTQNLENSAGAGRLKHYVAQWFQARADECTTCRDCGSQVGPWDECCNNCGRGNPARVASSAIIALIVSVGFVFIAVLATAI
jgi:hypothetical protein